MIIVLNGPLGIGKSTLAEALMERLDRGTVRVEASADVARLPPAAEPGPRVRADLAKLPALSPPGERQCAGR